VTQRRRQHLDIESRIIALLEKNLVVLNQLTAVLTRLSHPAPDQKFLSRAEVCKLLKVTPATLSKRIQRKRFPRPTYGSGARALWRVEDVQQAAAVITRRGA
jgi:predicted DNA-binding transcriptional regulator AlpA